MPLEFWLGTQIKPVSASEAVCGWFTYTMYLKSYFIFSFFSSEFWVHVKKDYLIGPDKYKERHGHPFHRRRFHDCKMPGCRTKVKFS